MRNVFPIAAVLDAIYQFIVQQFIYPLELLFTSALLAVVPYCVCLAEAAPGSIVTRVIVTRASGALLGHTICTDRMPGFCKIVKSAAERR